MIRINLLEKRQEAGPAARQAKVPKAEAGGGGGGLTNLLTVLIVLAGLGVVGWFWYHFNSQVKELETAKVAAQRDLDNLKNEIKAMDTFTARKKALEQRVQLITDLKRRQNVPVQLLDMVSKQVPDFLWLEGMEERAGAISLRGKATTYNAVSSFYNNLRDSPFFADVTLGTTRKVPEGVSFVLSCRFLPPRQEEGQPEGKDAAPAPPEG